MAKCYLDRDGIFNHHVPYVGTEDRFIWHYEIIEILKKLKKYDYNFCLITNQSGIARGFYTYKDFLLLSEYMKKKLNQNNIDIEIRFCPHLPSDNCNCRKPNIGMLDIDFRSSKDIFIGDQESDMICAHNAGVKHRWLINPVLKSNFSTRSFVNHKELLDNLDKIYIKDVIS